MESCSLPLLCSACVVPRYCLPELPHVRLLLDAWLDNFSADLDIVAAYRRCSSLRYVKYVAARESKVLQDPFYKRWLLNRTGEMAAFRGDSDTLQYLMDSYLPGGHLDNVTDAAAVGGQLKTLQWLFDKYRERAEWGGVEMTAAMEKDHPEVVHWLWTHAVPREDCRERVLISAAKAGYLEVVQGLCEDYGLNGESALQHAIIGGQAQTATWIIERYDLSDMALQWYFPLRHGDLQFLKLLKARNLGSTDKYSLSVAAAHLDVLQWLHDDLGLEVEASVAREACEQGHLDVLQWIYDSVCKTLIQPYNMLDAAEYGQYETVKWVHEHTSLRCSTAVMDFAARDGNLDMVKWLHANRVEGCSETAMNGAATNGHLDVVQWLHENRSEGCTTAAMDGAAANGHLEMVKWLQQHRTDGCSSLAMNKAAGNGHLEVVKWLQTHRKEGCTTLAMDWAARGGHLEIVKFLHENRREGCTTDAMDKAAGKGYLNVVKWLHENRSEGCTRAAMDRAATKGHLSVVKWLYFNRSEGCTRHTMIRTLERGHFDVAMFLYVNRSLDFDFSNHIVIFLSLEVQEWVLANTRHDLSSQRRQVLKPDWYSLNFQSVQRPRKQETSQDKNAKEL